MPKYEKEFDADSRKQILASEHQWFDKGTLLYNAHLSLKAQLSAFVSDMVYVGKPIACRAGSGSFEKSKFEIIPLMLYGMALECWLKGLIVMAVPRNSAGTRKLTSNQISELMSDSGELSEDAYLDELFSTIERPEIQELIGREEAERKVENNKRYEIVSSHQKHNLVHLCEKAEIKDLKGDDFEWLRFFSMSIMMGRYPSLFVGKEMQPWFGVASNEKVFERLNSLVFERYEELLAAGFDLD